jgi:hypothetical protein
MEANKHMKRCSTLLAIKKMQLSPWLMSAVLATCGGVGVLGGGGWKFKASPGNGQRDPIYKITRSK